MRITKQTRGCCGLWEQKTLTFTASGRIRYDQPHHRPSVFYAFAGGRAAEIIEAHSSKPFLKSGFVFLVEVRQTARRTFLESGSSVKGGADNQWQPRQWEARRQSFKCCRFVRPPQFSGAQLSRRSNQIRDVWFGPWSKKCQRLRIPGRISSPGSWAVLDGPPLTAPVQRFTLSSRRCLKAGVNNGAFSVWGAFFLEIFRRFNDRRPFFLAGGLRKRGRNRNHKKPSAIMNPSVSFLASTMGRLAVGETRV